MDFQKGMFFMMNNMINTLKRTIACAISMMMTMTFMCAVNTKAANDEYTPLYEAMVEELNEYRASEGLEPLSLNETLCDMAEIRSQEITVSFSHTRPDGRKSSTIFEEFDYAKGYSGENIGYHFKKSPSAILEAWLDSEGHRANMFSADYDSIGVGLYEENGYYYWTQVFSSEVEELDLSFTLGDVNLDGKIDATDSSLVLSAYSQMSKGATVDLTEEQLKAADVNGDGQVDSTDSSSILKYYSMLSIGLNPEF